MATESVFVDAGRRGARKRWGAQPRVVSLASLDDEQRALVHAFVRMAEAVAEKRKAADVSETSSAASAEGHGNDLAAA